LHRFGGCDAEREVSLPHEDIEFKLAHSLDPPKDSLPYEEREENKNEEIMYRDKVVKSPCKNEELMLVKVSRMDSFGNSSMEVKSEEEFHANTISEIKKAADGIVQRNNYNEFRLSSYNADQVVLNKLKHINFTNEIVEREENYDDCLMERNKSSYLESGEHKVKLASSKIAYISHDYKFELTCT
jgi:hypothetical protein